MAVRLLFAGCVAFLYSSSVRATIINEIPNNYRRMLFSEYHGNHLPMLRQSRKDSTLPEKRSWVDMRSSPPANVTALLHDNIILECAASGSPAPTIYWVKEGRDKKDKFRTEDEREELTNSIDMTALPLPRGSMAAARSRLFLDCLNRESEGIYTCIAANKFSEVSASTLLKVNGHHSNYVSPCSSVKKSQGQPSRIILWTDTYLQLAGRDAILECRAIGKPAPEIIWLDERNRILSESNKFRFSNKGDLIIRDLTWEDMGGYTCIATNEYGSDDVTTFVYPLSS